jgi:tripartite-type tricarboxylate transporter receptor subunit TctC
MRERIGQPIIIENVGGADGSIGVGRAARARPDGYTLCVGTLGTHVQNGAFCTLPYDVLHGFVPITPLASIPFVLFARKDIPADNLKDLVAWLKAHTGQASAIRSVCGSLRLSSRRKPGRNLSLFRTVRPSGPILHSTHRFDCRWFNRGTSKLVR